MQPSPVIRFGVFELDSQAGELRKHGLKIKLQDQPFQILVMLLEQPGQVVTREQLHKKLWSDGTVIDFEHGLNAAIQRLRQALGDSAENPRFVETLARRGYRFLAPVEEVRGIQENNLPVTESPQQTAVNRTWQWRWQLLPWALVAILSFAVVYLATAYFRKPPRETRLVRFQIPLPELVTFDLFDFPVISPNGERVVIAGRGPDGKRHLWVRSLDSNSFQLLAGTEECPCLPGNICLDTGFQFWSPDSRSVAYFCNDQIRRIDVTSGLSQTVCRVRNWSGGGSWSADGTMLVSTGPDPTVGLYRVPAVGGKMEPVLPPEKLSVFYDYPQFLPDGRHFLYCRKVKMHGGNGAIYLASLDSKDTKMLIPAVSNVSYAPPGFLIYGRRDTLLAQPFDLDKLSLTGAAAAIREPVAQYPGELSYFSVSENGVLAYRGPTSGDVQLTWYKRDGTRQASVGAAGRYLRMNMATDARRLTAQRSNPGTTSSFGYDEIESPVDIWSLELSSGIFTRVTSSGESLFPVMSPDGREVVFSSRRSGKPGLYRKVLGSRDELMLFESNEWPVAQQWLRDGTILFLFKASVHTFDAKGDFYRMPVSGERNPVLLFKTAFAKRLPNVSSDGQWVAYQSDESGIWEVYIAAFPSFMKNRQVSVNGGCQPLWRKDGKELFYLSLDGRLMSIDVSSGAGGTSVPRALFQVPFHVNEAVEQYAVTGDGNKFLIAEPVERTSPPITVVLNWTVGLKQ